MKMNTYHVSTNRGQDILGGGAITLEVAADSSRENAVRSLLLGTQCGYMRGHCGYNHTLTTTDFGEIAIEGEQFTANVTVAGQPRIIHGSFRQ
jgi:hypothetical protein